MENEKLNEFSKFLTFYKQDREFHKTKERENCVKEYFEYEFV